VSTLGPRRLPGAAGELLIMTRSPDLIDLVISWLDTRHGSSVVGETTYQAAISRRCPAG